ncbi:MAG: NAD(P)H-hydrate dehydratase [Aquificae bacterium]|nr:NAD(P)H-hydrate dehydratase [Aquificota bacterium]
MKLVTAAEMRRLDEQTINELGLPSLTLMENAARATLQALLNELGPPKRLLVLAGKGNNGGDGIALARLANELGLKAEVYLALGEPKGDARFQLELFKKLGGEVLTGEPDFSKYDLAVDALFGTGFEPPLRGEPARLAEKLNASPVKVLAVDLPSGLSADEGAVKGPAVRADLTVTFQFPKLCHVLYPASAYCGKVFVADISIPPRLAEGVKREVLLAHELKLYRRSPDTYKTREGHLLVVGGSEGKTGAVALACRAATRAGAGLVTAGVPGGLAPVLETLLLEEMVLPLGEGSRLSLLALNELLNERGRYCALVLGPGMGRYEEGQDLVVTLLERWEGPLLIDADGLNNLADAGRLELLRERPYPTVLTPHLGEFERLSGVTPKEAAGRLTEVARAFAERYGCYLVLKGARTAVAAPDGEVFLSVRGTPAMAKGGSGDALAGVLGALLCKLEPKEALKLGVYLHGLAGELAEKESHREGMRVLELVEALPKAYALLERLQKSFKPSYPLFKLLEGPGKREA